MKNIGIIGLLFLMFFSSCRQDVENVNSFTSPLPIPTFENYEQPVEAITASVVGFVVDENEQPVKNATIRMAGNTTTTDEYGHFFFNDRTMNHKGTLVTVEKAGYFEGSRRFFPVADEQNRVTIEMLPKVFSSAFNSQDGGVVNANGGASVEFNANSIQTSNGTIYNGNVNVATRWMDPTDLRTMNQMPGNLQGLRTDAEEVGLATFGMIAVELEGDNGEALNIAEGFTATLIMPVPSSISNAPSEIPLWSFSKEYGVWIEESSATLQNGNYVGEVSHFSFWNCDFPGELVDFDAVLVDDNGNPLAYHYVHISFSQEGWWGSGSGSTCEEGQLSGLIPANEVLTLEVYDICGNVVFTQEIGPFSEDTDLGTIVVTGSTINATTLTGEVVDCDGNGITNSVIIAEYSGLTQYSYTDGSTFEFSVTSCASTSDITITAVDLDDLIQSEPVTSAANGTFDLGAISVCEGPQLENYISITVDGVTQLYPGARLDAYQDSTTTNAQYYNVSAFDNNQTTSIYFGWSDEMGIVTGDFLNSFYIETIQDSNNGWVFWGETSVVDNFTITTNGLNSGDTVEGNFNAAMIVNQADSTTVNLAVEFSLLRQ